MTMTQEKSTTPMMEQWNHCKEKAKDALLFFRLGDFYEAFYEDAKVIAKELSLTLTKRQSIPMCGVPFHTCESYIDKLVNKGYKIAIAEQVEDPKQAKGIVERKVVRFVTPGTTFSSSSLKDNTNNYFASLCQIGSRFGLAFIDITTSEFKVMEFDSFTELSQELHRIRPSELLVSKSFHQAHSLSLEELSHHFSYSMNIKDKWLFDHQIALAKLHSHFKSPLESFGLKGMSAAMNAAGALLIYLEEELFQNIAPMDSIQTETFATYMKIDHSSMKNLEIIESPSEYTLLKLIDHTLTAMGGRLLKKWISHPLSDLKTISQRLNSVEHITKHLDQMDLIRSCLENIKDLERLIMKIMHGMCTPRDLHYLAISLEEVGTIKQEASFFKTPLLETLFVKIHDFSSLCNTVLNALTFPAPIRIQEQEVFQEGYNSELDELRSLCKNSKYWMSEYQNELRESLQIKTLKVGFTKVFGYYIDVSKGQAHKVPPFFQRRQTLVNSERFTTDELKEHEIKILNAEENIQILQERLYQDLKQEVQSYTSQIQETAKAIAQLDILLSFAKLSIDCDYVKPDVNTSKEIHIEKGRHPVVEIATGKNYFISNDTNLLEDSLCLITGPNMSGKSTYIRQVAILVILAQIGCFVPASSASIGIVDQLFSRIGASDDLSKGQSTFMVEMSETANILNHATDRSLVILDEIGRGTSTYDGISIAWSVCEYLLQKKIKTLFATHYWELTDLEKVYPGAKNYQVCVEENEKEIIFLHKIIEGGTDKSYGIHVAKLAGIPPTVVQKAKQMLKELEAKGGKKKKQEQLSLFDVDKKQHPLIDAIKELELDLMTPIEALQTLMDYQKTLS